MPLTVKGQRILRSFKSQYGKKQGEEYFYSSINKGKIKGAERKSMTKSYRHHSVSGKSSRGGYRKRV